MYIVCNGVKRGFDFTHELSKYRSMRNSGDYTQEDMLSLRALLACGNIPPGQRGYLQRELSLMTHPRALPLRKSEGSSMYDFWENEKDPAVIAEKIKYDMDKTEKVKDSDIEVVSKPPLFLVVLVGIGVVVFLLLGRK